MTPRVRLKYCGGCNPDYDRIALVEDIKARLKGIVVWVSTEDDSFDLVLAVHGCKTACADVTAFSQYAICHITSPEDAEAFVARMRMEAQDRR